MSKIKKEYFANGEIKNEVPYNENDQVHGIMKGWHANGQIEFRTSARNNQFHGPREWWDMYGNLIIEEYYLYNEQVSEEEYKKHELIEKLSCLK